jgi:hypothetical protein
MTDYARAPRSAILRAGMFGRALLVPASLLAAVLLPRIGCYWAWVLSSFGSALAFMALSTLGFYGPY